MQGITIKIIGYRYYEECDIEKTGYDYAIIGKDIGDNYATRRVKEMRQGNDRGHRGYAQGISNHLKNRGRNIIQALRIQYSEE